MKNALRQFYALLGARNREFWRDRAALGWSLAFPAFVIIGLYVAFSDDNKTIYKVGLLGSSAEEARAAAAADPLLARFLALKHTEFIPETDSAGAQHKVARHQLDLLIAPQKDNGGTQYWVNTDSANGYVLEQLLVAGHRHDRRW